MEETSFILPTLEHLLKVVLDYEAQLHDLRELLSASLMVNLPWTWYLQNSPEIRANSRQLQAEIIDLTRLMHDTKKVIMEFIPNYFKAIAVQVEGQVYFVSKIKTKDNQSTLLVVKRRG